MQLSRTIYNIYCKIFPIDQNIIINIQEIIKKRKIFNFNNKIQTSPEEQRMMRIE